MDKVVWGIFLGNWKVYAVAPSKGIVAASPAS